MRSQINRSRNALAAFAWVELLLIFAIVAVILLWIIRIRYGREWLDREYQVAAALGISAVAYDLAKTAILLVAMICYVIYRFRRSGPRR